VNKFFWAGHIKSVNKWLRPRVIKRGKKYIGTLYETAEFKKFKASLAATFMGGNPMMGYVDMKITVCMGWRSDTGNIEKAIGDTLEKCKIIQNDRYIRNIYFERHYHPISTKNKKYYDLLIIELTHVPEKDMEQIELEKTTDMLGVGYDVAGSNKKKP